MILKPSQKIDGTHSPSPGEDMEAKSEEPVESEVKILRQPETRPISQDQLVIEVKGIYAGLVMVEAKCIDVDEKQTIAAQEQDPSKKKPLRNDQWQSLIALHKQLLHEHHDFFLASQHPSASDDLKDLVVRYSMPARMWRHGIHAFLEVLRHRLPESLEHMLAFIYIAYSMMGLLYETVRRFEQTWVECLGDLGRYRMAIEDDEPSDREVWSDVARFWYSKAADKTPTIGRLYHHLAILAKPYTLEQLSFYLRALTCVIPFESARGSIMTLFNPILNGKDSVYHRSMSMEPLTIKAHGLLFIYPERSIQDFEAILHGLNDGLVDEFVDRCGARFKKIGVFLAVSNIAAMLDYGSITSRGTHRSMIRRALQQSRVQGSTDSMTGIQTSGGHDKGPHATVALQCEDPLTPEEIEISSIIFIKASQLTFTTLQICLKEVHWRDDYIMPMFHVMLIFIWSIAALPCVTQTLDSDVPWISICSYLNQLATKFKTVPSNVWNSSFPITQEAQDRPPPEDYVIRGQDYTVSLFPETWFKNAKVDDEERVLERSSNDDYRRVRCLWLGARICALGHWIRVDSTTNTFHVNDYVQPKTEGLAHVDDLDTGANDVKMSDVSFPTADAAFNTSSFLRDDHQQGIEVDINTTVGHDTDPHSGPSTRTATGLTDVTASFSMPPTRTDTTLTDDETSEAYTVAPKLKGCNENKDTVMLDPPMRDSHSGEDSALVPSETVDKHED